MKTSERTALIYGLSFLGATAISYAVGGKRGKELVTDAVIWGVAGGTVANLAWASASGEVSETLTNGFLGATPQAAVKLLAQSSPDFTPGKRDGVKVGVAPEDPYIVNLDAK